MTWTLEQAVEVCKKVEEFCPKHACHVALTGGTLYKEGERKDLDLLFYRIRQEKTIRVADLFDDLEANGFDIKARQGWVVKAIYEGKDVDLFFPEFDTTEKPEIKPKTSLFGLWTAGANGVYNS